MGAEVGELETCKTIGEERKFLFAIVNNDSDNAVAVGGADAEYPSWGLEAKAEAEEYVLVVP